MSMRNVTMELLKLDDLNDDVLLNIFDAVEPGELPNLAEMSSRFRQLIATHKLFHIRGKLIQFSPSINYEKIIDFHNDNIYIYKSIFFAKFLRNFGQLISRIGFHYIDEFIAEYVNKYCSESLVEITFSQSYEYLNVSWKKPFKKLRKFDLDSIINRESNMNLTHIFPALQHLIITTPYILKGFDQYFPNTFKNSNNFDINVLFLYKKFMKANRRIREVFVSRLDLDLLRIISENLPNLETMELNGNLLQIKKRILHFKSVKKFIFGMRESVYDTEKADVPIVFHQLNELEVWSNINPSNKMIDFIIRNHALRILSMTWQLNSQQWTKIIDNLPHLLELKTSWQSDNDPNGLLNILAGETSFKKVTFYIGGLNINYAVLRNLLHPKWQPEDDNTQNSLHEFTFVCNT